MEAQKVCIIGGGLTGLITATVLSRLNLKIDLFASNYNKKIKSNRTTAISEENYNYLKKLKIFQSSKKEFWPCSNIELYSADSGEKFNKILEFNNNKNKKKQLLYMMDNSIFVKSLIRAIKKNNLITFKNNYKVHKILTLESLKILKSNKRDATKYNLVIICTGGNSSLTKSIFHDRSFTHSYDEISVTTILKHNYLKNNVARQIFFDDEILALLPISNTKTSVVWSLKKSLFKKYKNNSLLKYKLLLHTNSFLKKTEFISKLEFKDLNFVIKKKYFKDRMLLFGDSLHVVHPLVGQGFNMVIRDLISLEKILKNKVSLGLDIGSDDILAALSNEIKPQNFVYSLGIDFLKKGFSFKGRTLKEIRNKIISLFNKNNFLKSLFFNFADKGLKF